MASDVPAKASTTPISMIQDDAWTPIEYTDDGEAEVAECDYTTGAGKKMVTRRSTHASRRQTPVEVVARLASLRVVPTSTAPLSSSTSSTGNTSSSNSRSAASNTVPDSSTSRRATSTPTRPGCNSWSLPATDPLDRPPAESAWTTNSSSPAPDGRHCGRRPTGHKPRR